MKDNTKELSSNYFINNNLIGYCYIHGRYYGSSCPYCMDNTSKYTFISYLDVWQSCPKCNGDCEVDASVANKQTKIKCKICNGKGIISKFNGKPPLDFI